MGVPMRSEYIRLIAMGRCTLTVGDAVPWAGGLDWIERRKGERRAEFWRSWLSAPGCDTTWLPPLLLSHDMRYPQSVSQSKLLLKLLLSGVDS